MPESLTSFEPVADRVFVAVAEPAGVNIGLVVGTTGALVIDTGSSPEQGRAILDAARAVAGAVEITHVVVTHRHWDHLYGLAAFEGVASYGHVGLADDVDADPGRDVTLAEHGLSREGLVLPTTTFTLAAAISLGDCHAELVHFGKGHTASDVVVIVPERAVVFAGDLLEESAHPSVGPDSHLKTWPATLDGTLGTLRPDSVIIPGHGKAIDRMAAFMQRAELHWLHERITGLFTSGVPLSTAYGAADDWPWDAETIKGLLPHVYASLAASGLVPRRSVSLPLRPL